MTAHRKPPRDKGRAKQALGHKDRKWLVHRFGKAVRFDEPMSRHTSFRIGGPADAFVSVKGIGELKMLISFCRENGISFLTVGDGTNLLVTDAGVRGVVVTWASGFRTISIHRAENGGATVRALAGARTRMLCRFAVDSGLAGLNFAVGIPGTVGGALMMNAGTPQGCMADVVEAVEILHPGKDPETVSRERLRFSCRRLQWGAESDSVEDKVVLLSGFFRLHRADPNLLKAEADALLKARREKQPWRSPSAGCFFKNPPGAKSAGELIDSAGLKGKSMGGARVSRRHANFLVNTGKASASDVLALAKQVQETVSQVFGVHLEPEVKIIGS